MKISRAARIAIVLLLVVALVPLTADAQDQKKKKKKKKAAAEAEVVQVAEAGQMFERNELEALVAEVETAAAEGRVASDALYFEALARQKLEQPVAARRSYAALAARPETEVWHWIGASATALLDEERCEALEAADEAVELAPDNRLAHYQRGLVLVDREEFQEAAAAFTRVLEIDGDFAYAHYYAGMSHHQVRNLMAAGNHLRRFLELAPEAPEKLEVQSILATIGG